VGILLDNIRLRIGSRSYIDALHAILAYKGWTSYPKPMLAGLTAFGFRFTVRRDLHVDSPTAYNWVAEHFVAADFVGITTSQQAGFTFSATFPLYRDKAVRAIKASLMNGTPAIMWKDGFVVAIGFDDKEELLYYCDGSDARPKVLPYARFGCSRYWYYQLIEHYIELDERAVIKESFIQAVNKWEVHEALLAESDYACGARAYDTAIEAFQSGRYDQDGAWEIIACYIAAKRDIRLYTQTVARLWPESRAVAESYFALGQLLDAMSDIVGASDGRRIQPEQARKLMPLLREAKRLEAAAIGRIRELMHETIANRFNDIGLR